MTAETIWEPGMPLMPHGAYRNYLFNFRDDTEDETWERSRDAASWPEPRSVHQISDDPLEGFVRWHRAVVGAETERETA